MKAYLLLGLMTSSLIACKPRTDSDLSDAQNAVNPAHISIESLTAEQDASDLPTITPAEVFADLVKRQGDKAGKDFIRAILTRVHSLGNVEVVATILRTSFDIEFTGDADSWSDQMLEDLTVKIAGKLEQNATLLNYVPTYPLNKVAELHKTLFLKSTYAAPKKTITPYVYDTKGTYEFGLAATNCASGAIGPEHKSFVESLHLYTSNYIPHDGGIPCFFDNSKALAEILNGMTNNLTGPVSMQIAVKDGQKKTFDRKVGSYEELLQLLSDAGLEASVFTTRSFVDFFGLTYRNAAGDYYALRAPLWYQINYQGKKITLPTEHSAYGIAFFDKKTGLRFAQAHYYIGLPKEKFAKQISYWRPHDAKDHAWSANRVEYKKTFTTGEKDKLSGVSSWLTAAAHVMRAFQWQQNAFNLPFNGYLMYVCNDSTAMSLAKYQFLTGVRVDGRLAHMFPIIRAQGVTDTTLKSYHISDLLMQQANIDKSFTDHTYPTDYQLETDDRSFATRIKTSFGPNSKSRLKYFPEIEEVLQTNVW